MSYFPFVGRIYVVGSAQDVWDALLVTKDSWFVSCAGIGCSGSFSGRVWGFSGSSDISRGSCFKVVRVRLVVPLASGSSNAVEVF